MSNTVVISDDVRQFLAERLTKIDDMIIRAAVNLIPEKNGEIVVKKELIELIFERIEFAVADFIAENRKD